MLIDHIGGKRCEINGSIAEDTVEKNIRLSIFSPAGIALANKISIKEELLVAYYWVIYFLVSEQRIDEAHHYYDKINALLPELDPSQFYCALYCCDSRKWGGEDEKKGRREEPQNRRNGERESGRIRSHASGSLQ